MVWPQRTRVSPRRRVVAVAVAAVTLTLFAALAVDGQTGTKKGQLPQGWKKLGLSEEQATKIRAIGATYKTKIDDLTKQIADLKTEMRTKQVALLTDAQKKALTALPIDPAEKPETKPDKK